MRSRRRGRRRPLLGRYRERLREAETLSARALAAQAGLLPIEADLAASAVASQRARRQSEAAAIGDASVRRLVAGEEEARQRRRRSVESAGGKGPLVDDEVRRAIEEKARKNGKGEEREMGELEC